MYNHVAGDGREYVITDDTAMKIRAEDGRSITGTDISMFIQGLPNGKDTGCFLTEDASGSTSQAANVVESMEAGARVLLIDEDTSATNFMIRDELMQRVIHRDKEPIIPFLERIEELYQRHGISTILVAGSSGAYFHAAHHIIQMDGYLPRDITAYAKHEAQNFPLHTSEIEPACVPNYVRIPKPSRELGYDERVKLKTLGQDGVSINRETINLRYVEQLVDAEQLTALAYGLTYAYKHLVDGKKTLQQVIGELRTAMTQVGLERISEGGTNVPFMAYPRVQELFACFNRYRKMKM